MHHMTRLDTPLGALLLVADEEGLCRVCFAQGERYPARIPADLAPGGNRHIDAASLWLNAYFRGEVMPLPVVALHWPPDMTETRRLVWERLQSIGYGETRSYGALAKEIAADTQGRARPSARAVGGAAGHNPFSILVPCHRLIGANGEPTGYAGGLGRKRWLLGFERRNSARR